MLDTQSSDAGYTVVVISLLSLGAFVEAVVWTHKSTIKPYMYTGADPGLTVGGCLGYLGLHCATPTFGVISVRVRVRMHVHVPLNFELFHLYYCS